MIYGLVQHSVTIITPNRDFKDMPLFDIEHLRNGILSDCKIFNNVQHRAASLRR